MNTLSHTSRIRQRIAKLSNSRRVVERELLGRRKMLKGTVTEILRTCGKPGCRCTQGQKHKCYQLSSSVEGKTKTRNVPRKYLVSVKRLTSEYRKFRRARAALVRINAQILEMINKLEAARTMEDFTNEYRRQKS